MSRRAGHALDRLLCLAVLLSALALQACTTVEERGTADVTLQEPALHEREISRLPSPNAGTSLGAPQRAVVLFRLAAKVDGKPLESPFSRRLGDSYFQALIQRPGRDGEEPVHVSSRGLPTAGGEGADWLVLSLEPGRYDLSFAIQTLGLHSPASINLQLDPSVGMGGNPFVWGPFRLQIPRDVALVYAGTLTLDCRKTDGKPRTPSLCALERIQDESDLARQVAAASLDRFGSPVTALVVHQPKSDYGMASCKGKPADESLGQVLGVFVDLRREDQNGADPNHALDSHALEEKVVNCIGNAIRKAGLQLRPVGTAARLAGAANASSSLREMDEAIIARLREPAERSKLTASGMRYLVAVNGLTNKGPQKIGADMTRVGPGVASGGRTDTYVDVLTVDIQEACIVDEVGLQVWSGSATGVIFVYFILPFPLVVPAGDTEGRVCRVVAERVANKLARATAAPASVPERSANATQAPIALATPSSLSPSVTNPDLPKVGDRWTYNVLNGGRAVDTLTVAVVESSVTQITETLSEGKSASFKAERVFRSNLDPVSGFQETELPGRFFLAEFSPYVGPTREDIGREWNGIQASLTVTLAAKIRESWHLNAKVVGTDHIRVPAGEFETLKVEVVSDTHRWADNGDGLVRLTFWYAPGIKRTVKMVRRFEASKTICSYTDVYELASYQVN